MTDLDNPYAAPVGLEGGSTMHTHFGHDAPGRFRIFAVVIGVAVDIGITLIAERGINGMAIDHFGESTALWDFYLSVDYRYLFLPVGAACSVVGGFVTGVLARHRERAHGLGNVGLSLAYTLWLRSTGGALPFEEHPWLSVLEHVSVMGSIVLGAELARRRRMRRAPIAQKELTDA